MRTQEKLLPMRPEKWKHAQNNRKAQRQSQKDNQPKRYFLAERRPFSMCLPIVTPNQCDTLDYALKPRPIALRETAITRPYDGQERQANGENRCKSGVHHHQIARNVLAQNEDRIEASHR